MSISTDLLRQAVLQHAPKRHGVMQPATSPTKYHETRTAPTEDQLSRHLAGAITLAAPVTANGQASCIVYDIDGEAVDCIPALLDTARQRGLWAWGEWHVATNRGYVWIPFDRLTNAAALAQIGQELVVVADLTPEQCRTLDNRTANNAITRLPFGRHTHTGQRGEVIFQDGSSAPLDADPEAALALWASRYQENPADQVASIVGLTPARPEMVQQTDAYFTPAQTTRAGNDSQQIRQVNIKGLKAHSQNSHFRTNERFSIVIPAPEAQQRWNAAHPLPALLLSEGSRQATGASWHCPCGQHRNNDRSPSLLLRPAKNARYGAYIVQGYSPTCLFHDPTLVFDAFNVYRLLHGLSNDEMLQLARRELGQNAPERPQTRQTAPARSTARPMHPAAPQTAAESPCTLPQPASSAATILARAAVDCSFSPAMRVLLATILDEVGERLTGCIRLATLISATGLTRRTIQTAQRRLERAGYLVITATQDSRGADRANHYTACGEGGRSNRTPLNIKACKGGGSARSAVEPAPILTKPALLPVPISTVDLAAPVLVLPMGQDAAPPLPCSTQP
jgi:hypothetical protein